MDYIGGGRRGHPFVIRLYSYIDRVSTEKIKMMYKSIGLCDVV